MEWWRILIVLVVLYLLVSLGPWLALQILAWVGRRPGRSSEAEEKRLQRLTMGEHEHGAFWPRDVRPGRYQHPDRLAQEHLVALATVNAESGYLWPLVAGYHPARMGIGEVAALGAWKHMPEALRAWGNEKALLKLIAQGEGILAALEEQQLAVSEIPNRVRATLNELRAESRRLEALLEAEEAAGTQGLENVAARLQACEGEVEKALDLLAQAAPESTPQAVLEVDEVLKNTSPAVEELDHTLQQAAQERARAQDLVARSASALKLAQERWEGLKARGATEPALARTLGEMLTRGEEVAALAKARTLESYQRIHSTVAALDEQLEAYTAQVESLDDAISRSKEAIAGDVEALAQARATCDALRDEDPLLDPDQSLALIEKAAQTYAEAERQRGMGTIQGYNASITLAQMAAELLAKAQAASAALGQNAESVRTLLDALGGEVAGEWRARAERVREQLHLYPRHFEGKLAGDVGEAVAALDQVEVDLERISPNVRYQRRFRQSELSEALQILSHARETMEKAKGLIVPLENEAARLAELRQSLEGALADITKQTLPELRQLAEAMLPELQQHLEALEKSFTEQARVLLDPSQVNYDEATGQWLPGVLGQIEELRLAHREAVQRYRELTKEASKRLERQWARLSKLEPGEGPAPEEEAEKLAGDLETWRADAQRQAESPLALRDIVGRRASALEQRLEAAQREIMDGRRTLEALDRQYQRAAQEVHDLRNNLRELERASRWPGLSWDMEEAERAWEKAVELERKSRAATTLLTASDQVQQAVGAAQQAQQLYARARRQVEAALGRLDDEQRGALGALERWQHHAEELRAQGESEELTAVEEVIASGQRALSMAEAATTFEDVLRYLRDARGALGRA